MLLIACPWCGPRNETEFHYGGQAHVRLPGGPGRAHRRGMGALPVLPRQPEGRVRRALVPHAPAAGAGSTPSATPSPTRSGQPHDPAVPSRQPRRAWIASRPLRRSASTGASYTGYAGDTLASALLANGVHTSRPASTSAGRAGSSPAGVEEPSALVQIETPFPEPMLTATTVELVRRSGRSSLAGRGRLATAPDDDPLRRRVRALRRAGRRRRPGRHRRGHHPASRTATG